MKEIKVHFNAFGDSRENVFDLRTFHDNDIDACDYMFHVTNAPESLLDEMQHYFATRWRALKLRCLSVGDIVEVNGIRYSCAASGWNKL